MPERLERAKRYRQYAQELRAMAPKYRDSGMVKKIANLARDWETMAEELEQAARKDGIEPGHGSV